MKRVLILVSLLAIGCQETLDPTHLVTEPRVVGVVSRVVGDETRSTPRPGEQVELEWLLLDRDRAAIPASWAYLLCEPAPTTVGVGFCAGPPIAFDGSTELSEEAPRMTIDIAEATIVPELLLIGVVCMDGAVNVAAMPDLTDVSTFDDLCSEGSTTTVLTLPIEVLHGEDPGNQLPAYEEAMFDFDVWTAEPVAENTGCAALDMPQVQVDGEELEITIRSREEDRESYFVTRDDGMRAPRMEELQNSLYTTYGAFDRSFVFMEESARESFNWTPPTTDDELDVPADGLLVRFTFVMRDLRSGVASMQRAACVTP